MKIRDSHYGTSSIFRKQDGPQTYSSFKTGEGTTGKAKERRALSKNQRKRDFDETHNSGLEKQTKAEGNHY